MLPVNIYNNTIIPVLFLSQPLPLPDITVADSVHSLAMACIWVHLAKKVCTPVLLMTVGIRGGFSGFLLVNELLKSQDPAFNLLL